MKPHIKVKPVDRERKLTGFIPLREANVYSIRLHMVGGEITAAQLAVVSHIATKYGTGAVHMTTRQGIEISSIPEKHLDVANRELAAAGLRPAGSGPWLRGIIACPGTRCRNGLIETTTLANLLYDAAGARRLPHKFKIGITGCPNDCAGAKENDFGVTGVLLKTLHRDECSHCEACVRLCPVKALSLDNEGVDINYDTCIDCGKCVSACPVDAWQAAGNAYRVTLGAKGGRVPLTAHTYPYPLESASQVLALLNSTLDWYTEHGKPKERFGDTLHRIGWEKFLVDSLRPAAVSTAANQVEGE